MGVEDNAVIIFSDLMDAKSLFLTANADTPYFMSFIDLSKGPMVVETPPLSLGAFDDMWFRWVIDLVCRARTAAPEANIFCCRPVIRRPARQRLPRGAIAHDPRASEAAASWKTTTRSRRRIDQKTLKIYPYHPGGFGHEHRASS